MGDIAWRPDESVRERAQLTRFLRTNGFRDFDEMYRFSIAEIPAFTGQVLRHLDIDFQRPYSHVLDLSEGVPWAKWCIGGGLNIAQSCLRHDSSRPAVIWEPEEGACRTLSYGELSREVRSMAAHLGKLGVRKGDAVAILLPMLPETVVALVACAFTGAVAVPLFSGYGPAAIESRIRDVEAKVVITCDSFPRRGKPVAAKSVVDQAVRNCPSVKHIVVVSREGETALDDAEVAPELTDAEDRLIVLYTSGTTGRPKGILHSHCGFPVKAAQDMSFGTDVGPGTRISWITDLGWMMGPWLIYGSLILGATIVLYDGAPDYPDASRLWAFCERHQVEVLGISPTLVRALAVNGAEPVQRHDLRSVRIFASTGEPWNLDPWWWLFETAGRKRVPIINYSGGTEISGGILMGNPLLPIKPCSFPAPCPGIDVDIVSEAGAPAAAGSVGELVIRKPWIGMARGFLNDPQRYLDTYWSRWPELWAHGDWAQRDQDGHWYILGRSDDTLKIAGKRVGPAEVESVLVSHESVAEAAVIGVPHAIKGECMIGFTVLAPERTPSRELAEALQGLVGDALGKPLRPDRVHFVDALPRTRNNKVMRRVLRAAYLGEDAGDLSALENPAAVESIRQTNGASL